MPAEIRPCAITPSRMGCTIGTPGGRSERIPLRADGDPAAALKGAIHRPKLEHRRPFDSAQIPSFLKALDSCGGHRTTFRLIFLAFVRTAELRGAAWAEADLLQAEWPIPGSRMKMREGHLVPWSDQALALLEKLHTRMSGPQWLFQN